MRQEPFGLYTLNQCKEDSQRNVNSYHDKWIEKRGHSMGAIAFPSLLLAAGLVTLTGTMV